MGSVYEFLGLVKGILVVILRDPMVSLWILWSVYRIYAVSLRNHSGQSMGYLWSIYGIFVVSLQDFCEQSLGCHRSAQLLQHTSTSQLKFTIIKAHFWLGWYFLKSGSAPINSGNFHVCMVLAFVVSRRRKEINAASTVHWKGFPKFLHHRALTSSRHEVQMWPQGKMRHVEGTCGYLLLSITFVTIIKVMG